jgi:hypothetical protein
MFLTIFAMRLTQAFHWISFWLIHPATWRSLEQTLLLFHPFSGADTMEILRFVLVLLYYYYYYYFFFFFQARTFL